jgi:CBS domain-containing protein
VLSSATGTPSKRRNRFEGQSPQLWIEPRESCAARATLAIQASVPPCTPDLSFRAPELRLGTTLCDRAPRALLASDSLRRGVRSPRRLDLGTCSAVFPADMTTASSGDRGQPSVLARLFGAVLGAGVGALAGWEQAAGARRRENRNRDLSVEQVMAPKPICCHPDTRLHDAAALLWKQDVGVLPVVSATSEGQVCAMITDRDIAMAAYTQGRPLHEIHVRSACSGPVRSCRPSDDLAEALAIMADGAVRRLVVVDEGNHPIGVISLSDIARVASAPRASRNALERAVCQTLSSITTPNRGGPSAEEDSPRADPHSLV